MFVYISSISLSSVSVSSTLLPEFSILNGQETDVLSTEKVYKLFVKWKELHGKVYDHQEEEEHRLRNFRNNLKFILEINTKRKSELDRTVGLHNFADLSNEEFKEMYFLKYKGPKTEKLNKKGNTTLSSGSCNAPASLDWRDKGVVTPVKDQKKCKSCWAFSVTGSIESAHAIATGKLISLSEQELIDCDIYDRGCEWGRIETAYMWIVKNGGLDSEEDYPYTGCKGECDKSKLKRTVVSISRYQKVRPNEDDVLCAVAKQPVAICICTNPAFQHYKGGIFNGDCPCSINKMNHCMLIVGYGSQDGEDYWIVKNDWGTKWGRDGYILMKRGSNVSKNGVCGMYLQAMYPISRASSPPSQLHQPPPPPTPTSNVCDEFTYCTPEQTCCCVLEIYNVCLLYGCCVHTNAVCCLGSSYCCPSDYPICDIITGKCNKKPGGTFGVDTKKIQMAKPIMPREKIEETMMDEYQLATARTQVELEKRKLEGMTKQFAGETVKLSQESSSLDEDKKKFSDNIATAEKMVVELREWVEQLVEDKRWLIESGFPYVVTNLLHSKEFNAPLAGIYIKAIAYGRHVGVLSGFKAAGVSQRPEDLPSYKPEAGEELIAAIKSMELLTYPYIQSIAKCFDQSLSVLQGIEPEGLNKELADHVFKSYIGQRQFQLLLHQGSNDVEGSTGPNTERSKVTNGPSIEVPYNANQPDIPTILPERMVPFEKTDGFGSP